MKMIEAGASRLGTSASVAIIHQIKNQIKIDKQGIKS
jgi:deoxyribose-phosphate aldolase